MDDEDPYRRWDAPALVQGALDGDSRSWGEIVRRHTPAVVARVRQFRLTPDQAEDVAQTVWLNLLENLDKLRDPHALPGWIATTARHECIRVTNLNRRTVPVDPQGGRLDGVSDSDLDARMLAVEREQALREGLAELPAHQREILLLLAVDPPLSYAEIAERLGVPVGSIGPTRGRGLARLRQTAAIKKYVRAWSAATADEGGRDVLALG
ncbi:RNA polymerase sigma factor [Cellulomonas fengjieae]|uniref:Sigma-70 family RNA polymerase sigma factor n=1 Tax=Cellulomonas fengjieae TaxID=2819978 RepID=A0ABS3SCR1_9CELL|nr:sigma-70 family RNA polymerase sigma factor [Cellulomonas fengjieae]MBO3083538.1 sigma-70 family RNA polymerase sigma factor [Cellulomonas fengjieae]QVI65143.1 sigma-70 family RNA polymerase sigma factor [Cellulomonas fengjieae]